jgi:hypothetical protein
MRSASKEVQAACRGNSLACFDTDQTELALALIGSRKDREATLVLAELLRYRLDGAGGETYHCYVLQHGAGVELYWKKTSPEKLAKQCVSEVTKRKGESGINDVSPDQICASKKSILSWQTDLVKAIKRGTQCNSEDF